MLDIMVSIAPLFIIIGLGALLRALKKADDTWIEVLNKYELYIGFPCLIIYNILNVDSSSMISWQVVLVNILVLIAILLFTILITRGLRLEKKVRNTYAICIFFGNIAYLGIPIIGSLIKDSGQSVAVHIAIYVSILFTLGIIYLETSLKEKKTVAGIAKDVFQSAPFLAVLVGVLLFFLKVQLPDVIHKSLQLVANTTSPIALLALGMFIYQRFKFNRETLHAVILTALKLLVVPALFIIIAKVFLPAQPFNISILEAAMPLAVTPFALSQIYPLNRHIIAQAVLLSTVLSIITIPLLATFLGI